MRISPKFTGRLLMSTSSKSLMNKFEGLHKKCRSEYYPSSEVKRFNVPDDKVPWTVEWSEYRPSEYTAQKVLKASWADPPIGANEFSPRFNSLDGNVDRRSFTGAYDVVEGRPRNILGRTGIVGRGILGRWGPNHAADPIVTRWKHAVESGEIAKHPQSGKPILQYVAILRGDSHEWAIPGGMVDPGEQVSATLKREFGEEALNSLSVLTEEQRKRIEHELEQLFASGGDRIYTGYVDDPRNTDNAWMETVAVNFHDEQGRSAARVELKSGSDAVGVQWIDIGSDVALYASHAQILAAVARLRGAHW